MRILGRKFYAYKSKNRRKNTPDSAFPRTLYIFLISRQKHVCGYSLEAPRRGASNEYPQHMFWSSNKKTVYLILALI